MSQEGGEEVVDQTNDVQKEKEKEEEIKENNNTAEIKASNNEFEFKIKEINTKIINSKNNFLQKLNNFVSGLSTNYNKYLSEIDKNSNNIINNNNNNNTTVNNEDNTKQYLLKLENIFQTIEDLQNNILENNNNLTKFLNKEEESKKDKKSKNEKILKINCGDDIRDCQKRLEGNNLEKIIIKELSSNILEEIFLPNKNENDDEKNNDNNNINENKQYNDIIIKKCNLENVNISQLFPNVNKLKLKKCKIPFNSKGLYNFNIINELYLENIGLVNENFNTILSDLKRNINFINNIKVFSIKNNKISIFNLELSKDNSEQKYTKLEFLNLSNNKISKISNNIFELLPSIKVIDLTDNNISFNSRYKTLLDTSKEKNCILFLGKNPGVIKEKNREGYCIYLKDCLPLLTNEHKIKNINLEGLFCGKTYQFLPLMNISNITIQLNTLNLSYNNLNDQDFIKLIENENKTPSIFSNLKKLILCSNYITEAGLENLVNGGYGKIFAGLKKLNLSGNPIKFNDLNMFKKFIEAFPKMKTLLIKHTPIEKDFNNYLKIRVQRKMEENMKGELSSMSDMDLQFEEFVAKEHYLKEKTKLCLKLMNTNGYKCLSIIRRYFPYLLENMKIETKFIDEDRNNRIMA